MSNYDSTFQINTNDRKAVAKFIARQRSPAAGIHLQLEPETLSTGTTVRCVANDQAQFDRLVNVANWDFVFGATAD
tara:strand:- start:1580 stop:1807 length:228 start_codon:yes stop_codon:yes gene_type:complete